MTTLATMKARIAKEVRRSNIDAQIADAIATAIDAYSDERFYFNESRLITFDTVAAQEFYTSADNPSLGTIRKIDYVKLYVGDYPYNLEPEEPGRVEFLSQNGTQTGQPLIYCYYAQQFRLWPVPPDVFTVKIGGKINLAAPTADDEAGNAWMIDAERLIRSRAKLELAIHVLMDSELASSMTSASDEAFLQLRRRSNDLLQQGGWAITPTQF